MPSMARCSRRAASSMSTSLVAASATKQLPVFTSPALCSISALTSEEACAAIAPAAALPRDNGKTLASFACPRRLDRGIEREQICLEGNIVDEPDDVGNLRRRLGDTLHCVGRLAHHRATFFSGAGNTRSNDRGVPRLVGILHHSARELLDRGGRLLDGRCLFGGPLRKVVGTGENLPRRELEGAGRFLEPAHHLSEPLGNRVGVVTQPRKGTLVVALNAAGQVGMCQRRKHVTGLTNPPVNGLDKRIDAARKPVELLIREGRVDPSAEVAGDRRIDHGAKRPLQLLHHAGAIGAARLAGGALALGHLVDLVGIVLEHLHG